MRIKIFQIDMEKDSNHNKFRPFKSASEINPQIYKNVYYGDAEAKSLEDVFYLFNTQRPPTHQGHSLSVSDIVEVCEGTEMVKAGSYYCDDFGFKEVDFDSSQCADMDGMRVVYVTPNHTPIDIRIGTELEDLQNAVGGLIEPIYCEPEGIILVGNDEAKLMGMKGNRHIGNGSSIIAGPFFVCGDDGEEFVSLNDEQVKTYMDKFAELENISDAEVQADTGFSIHFF